VVVPSSHAPTCVASVAAEVGCSLSLSGGHRDQRCFELDDAIATLMNSGGKWLPDDMFMLFFAMCVHAASDADMFYCVLQNDQRHLVLAHLCDNLLFLGLLAVQV
jgi:hypothetical protein